MIHVIAVTIKYGNLVTVAGVLLYGDSGTLLYFPCVSSFFRPPIFRRPWSDFHEHLPHNAVCFEIDYVL